MRRATIVLSFILTAICSSNSVEAQQLDFSDLRSIFQTVHQSSIFADQRLTEEIRLPDTLSQASHEKILKYLNDYHNIGHIYYNPYVIILFSGGTKNEISSSDNSISTYQVKGRLVDAQTGAGISSGTVMVAEANVLVNSDPSGYFELTLPAGNHSLKALGQGTFESNLELRLDGDQELNIELFEKTVQLDEVVVSTSVQDVNVVNLQPGSTTLGIEEISRVPALLGEVDISRAVISLPGVSTVGEGATGFNVRGGNIDQNLILMNGMSLFNSAHLLGFFSVFNPDILNDFTLYKGLIPADKGGRISSVLDVKLKGASSELVDLSASVGPINSKLFVNLPVIKQTSGLALGIRGAYPNYVLQSFPDDSPVSDSKASYFDVTARYDQQFGEKGLLSVDAYISGDEFRLTADTTFNYSTTLLGIKYAASLSEKWQLNLAGFSSLYRSGIEDRTLSREADFDNGISQYSASVGISYQDERFNHQMGLESNYYRFITGEILPMAETSEIEPDALPDRKAFDASAYFSTSMQVNSRLGVQLGLRATSFYNLGPEQIPVLAEDDTLRVGNGEFNHVKTGWEPRFSLNYRITGQASLKMGYSRTYQYIHLFSNTVASLPTDLWRPSDLNLKPVSAHIFSLGYYRNFRQNLIETSLEIFYKDIDNLIDFTNGTRVLLNRELVFNTLQGTAQAYGVELLLRKTRGKFTGRLAYTYSRAKSKFQSELPGQSLNRGESFPANFDRPHDLNLFGNFRLGNRWNTSLNFVYTTGRPISLPQSSFRFGGAIGYTDIFRNQFRVPDFHRLDWSVSLEGSNRKNRKWHTSWTFSLYNVYGRKNVFSVFINGEDGRPRQLSVLGAPFPSLTLNLKLNHP